MFLPLPKQTILVPSGPDTDPDRKHLYVILTSPCCDKSGVPSVAMVSFRSVDGDLPYDTTCVLEKGDHPFVKRPTWVDFGRANIFAVAKLENGIRTGQLIRYEPVSDALFKRVAEGLCTSPMTPPKIVAFYWTSKD
jgi:hypothetical protein